MGEPEDYYDQFDDNDCANCGGEGFVYGCSWDWQCDTYDEGEGTCLCTRRCDWCNPAKSEKVAFYSWSAIQKDTPARPTKNAR